MWGDDKSLIRVPRLRCDRCGRDAIVFQRYSGHHLCGDHFQRDLVARAKRTIRARGWIQAGDRIAVALSGGRSSVSLLHFLTAHFGMRPDLSLVAISVDEGTGSGRNMAWIERIAGERGIGWAGTSLAEEFGGTPDPGNGHIPGSCRDILRDYALTSLAKRVGATRLAVGTNLDDVARSVLLAVLRGEPERLLGGQRPGAGGIPRIRPFLRIPAQEVALYSRLNLPDHGQAPRPEAADPLVNEVRRILDEYTDRHPSTMFSLVNLGEALSGMSVPGSEEPRSCDGSREQCPATCPERRIRERVKGHG